MRNTVSVSTNPNNNVYITANAIGCQIVSESEQEKGQLLCRLFKKSWSAFDVLCDSRIIGAFLERSRDVNVSVVPSTSLTTKAIMIPLENGSDYYFMSILHHTVRRAQQSPTPWKSMSTVPDFSSSNLICETMQACFTYRLQDIHTCNCQAHTHKHTQVFRCICVFLDYFVHQYTSLFCSCLCVAMNSF